MISQYLSEQEVLVALDIIKKGLVNATASFSSLAKQNIGIKVGDFEIFDISIATPIKIEKNTDLTVLTTEIIGELHGKSYLIFDEHETAEIYASCLPPSVLEEGGDRIKEAVLKELDNILSAAVITELSNKFNLKIFGDVPYLIKLDKTELESYLVNEFSGKNEEDDTLEDNICLWIESKFEFENKHTLNPNFIWRLNERFVDIIQEATKNLLN